MDGEADDDDFELPFEYTPHPLVVGCHRHNHPHHHHNHLHCEHHYVFFPFESNRCVCPLYHHQDQTRIRKSKSKKAEKISLFAKSVKSFEEMSSPSQTSSYFVVLSRKDLFSLLYHHLSQISGVEKSKCKAKNVPLTQKVLKV